MVLVHVKRLAGWADGNRFSFLVLSLIALMLLAPMVQGGLGTLFLAVGTAFVLLMGCYAVSNDRRQVVVASILAVPALGRHLLDALVPAGVMGAHDNILAIPFFLYVLVSILNHIRRPHRVTRELVAAGLSVYLLIGHAWAQFYSVIHWFDPSAILHSDGTAVRPGELVYYSFVTLTTLGYGDITPATPLARSFTIVEAITGVAFMTVFIGGLVGAWVGNQDEPVV